MIQSKAPVRIAFGGGATDVEPYSSENGGYVVNATINKHFTVKLDYNTGNNIRVFSNKALLHNLEPSNELKVDSDLIKGVLYYLDVKKGMDISYHADPPKNAGLGASASLSCALIAGILKLRGEKIDKNRIAEMAFQVEDEVLKNSGGRQDQYAAVYGGFNSLEFQGGPKVRVERIKPSESFKSELESSLLLYYTGQEHVSGDLVKDQIQLYAQNKKKSKGYLDQLKQIAYNIKDSIISEDLEEFGLLLKKDLEVKSKFNPRLMTKFMDELNRALIKRGAIGGRVCGAGGGGCMIWVIKTHQKKKIIEFLNSQPGTLVYYKFTNNGLLIENL